MSELPPAPPPPTDSPPGIQPHDSVPPGIQPWHSVPAPKANRWLGRWAPYAGAGAGLALYLVGYGIAAIATLSQEREAVPYVALTSSIGSGACATLLALLAAIAPMANPHTRAFGAGLATSIAFGILSGGGVRTALLVA